MVKYMIVMLFFSVSLTFPMNLKRTQSFKDLIVTQSEMTETNPLIAKLSGEFQPKPAMLSLHQIDYVFKMDKVKQQTSPHMSLIYDVVTLPVADVKMYITSLMFAGDQEKIKQYWTLPLDKACIFVMLDGHTQALEKFYSLPESKAMERYYEIKKSLNNVNIPIGSLYVLPEEEYNSFVQSGNSFFYAGPVITTDDYDIIEANEHLKRHFTGREVLLLPGGLRTNPCNKKYALVVTSTASAPVGVGAGIFGLGALLGKFGVDCFFLKALGIAIGAFGSSVILVVFCCCPLCEMVLDSEKVTL